jgi:hypothetical protein
MKRSRAELKALPFNGEGVKREKQSGGGIRRKK